MADYAGAAASIYEPLYNADAASAKQNLDATNAGLDTNTRDANSAYDQAITNAQTTTAGEQNKSDFTLNTHGLWQSGLAANASRIIGQNYATNANNIAVARAGKLADIASKRQLAQSGYNTDLGGLRSKYSSAESKYVADAQAADAKQAAANARAAQSASNRAPSAYDRNVGFNNDLLAAFDAVNQPGAYHPFAREKVAQTLAATYGIPMDQAQKQVNSVFTDSWDTSMQQKGGYRK